MLNLCDANKNINQKKNDDSGAKENTIVASENLWSFAQICNVFHYIDWITSFFVTLVTAPE